MTGLCQTIDHGSHSKRRHLLYLSRQFLFQSWVAWEQTLLLMKKAAGFREELPVGEREILSIQRAQQSLLSETQRC